MGRHLSRLQVVAAKPVLAEHGRREAATRRRAVAELGSETAARDGVVRGAKDGVREKKRIRRRKKKRWTDAVTARRRWRRKKGSEILKGTKRKVRVQRLGE